MRIVVNITKIAALIIGLAFVGYCVLFSQMWLFGMLSCLAIEIFEQNGLTVDSGGVNYKFHLIGVLADLLAGSILLPIGWFLRRWTVLAGVVAGTVGIITVYPAIAEGNLAVQVMFQYILLVPITVAYSCLGCLCAEKWRQRGLKSSRGFDV